MYIRYERGDNSDDERAIIECLLKVTPPISLTPAFRCDRVDSVDLFYLHAPDRNIPLLDTLRAVHELASEGLFREWGISNYAAWETVDIWHTCK